jgi:hypothetical protein
MLSRYRLVAVLSCVSFLTLALVISSPEARAFFKICSGFWVFRAKSYARRESRGAHCLDSDRHLPIVSLEPHRHPATSST